MPEENNPQVAAEQVKKLHTALSEDEVFKDLIPQDLRGFVDKYKNPEQMTKLYTALSEDEVFKDLIPNTSEGMYDKYVLGKLKAEPAKEPSKSSGGQLPSRGGAEFGLNQAVSSEMQKPNVLAKPQPLISQKETVPKPSEYAPKQQVVSPFAGFKKSAESLPKKEKVGEERYGEMLAALRNDQSKAYPSYQALNKTVKEEAAFLNQQKPQLDAMIEQANILDADQQAIVNSHKNEVAKLNALTREVEEEAKTLQQRIDDLNVPVETRQQILDTFKQKVNFIESKKPQLEEGDNIVNQIYKDASLKNIPVKQKIDAYNTILGKHKQDIEELGKLEQIVNQNQRAINVLNKSYTRAGGQFEKEQQLLKEQIFDKRPLTEKIVSWKNETQASLYNTVVPSLVKSLGAAYKLAAIMTPLKGDMNALNDIVGDKILKFGDDIEVSREGLNKMTGFENPYADKSLYDEINPYNLSKGIANVIGSVGMTMAGGVGLARTAVTAASRAFLTRTGGQAAAFAQIYGNSYQDGIDAGLKNEQALMYASAIAAPSAILEQFGISKLFDLAVTKGGKKILQEAILNELKKKGGKMTAKEIFDFTSKKVVQLLSSGGIEGAVEVSQTGAEFLAKLGTEAITDADFEGNLTINDFKKQAYDSFVLGFAGGSGASLAIQNSPQAINTVAAEALTSPEKMQDFKDNLESLRINGKINEEGYAAANTALNKAIDVSKTVPATITNVDERKTAIDLIQKRDELTAQLETTDPDLAAPIQEELKNVKTQLQDLAKGIKPKVEDAAQPATAEEQVVAETVTPKVDEKAIKEEVRKKRDAELEQIQAIRADLGTDAELIDDLPEAVDNVIDRIDLSAPIDNVAINESIAALDKKFTDLEAYKNNPNRTHTIAQIEAMQDIFSQTKSEIQAYQEKQSENGIQAERTTETKTREPQTTTAESAPSQQEVTPKTTETTQQGKEEVISSVGGDAGTSLRGVKYSDIIVGDKYLEDILSDNKLSEEEKKQVREVFARGVDYFKFDKEGEQKFQQKFANPEDITDIADIIEGVSLAKEAEFNFYNTKNYENVKDAVNYIANNPNEYSPKVVKAVKEIKEKLDNPSSSMSRLYAIDVMKELGITEQPLKETPQAEELTTKTKQDGKQNETNGEVVLEKLREKGNENEGRIQVETTTPSADLAQQGEAATEVAKTEITDETKTQENIPAVTETDKGGEQSVVQEGLTEPTDKEIQVAAERLGIPLEPVTETPKTDGKVEPLTDAQLKLKEAKEKLSGTIDDVKNKFKALYNSNAGIIFDPKVKAKERFDFHMALRDLAVDAIRLGIVNIQQFSNVAGRQIDGALKLAWSEAQSLLSGTPTVINTVDDMENRLVQIQASALQREKDENDKLNKTFKGKIIDAYFAAYDSIFGNHLPAKRLIDKATNNAIDNIPNYNSGANTISQARERGKLVDAARRVLRLQNLIPGAKSYAKSLYDEKGAPIFRGLNAAKKEMLNNIIEMRTIISIDKRFAEKKEADLLRLNAELASATDPKDITRINEEIKKVEDRPNIRHTAAENGEVTSIYTALAYLASLQSTTDPQAKKTFEMLNDRATDYFAFMNELLLAKKNAGIISPELYNALVNNEYSKRQFLEYVLSDGSGGSYRMGNKSYSLDGIKKIELGSEGAMVQNKEWLMKANIMSTARSIYSNNARVGLLDFVRLDPNNGLFREQKPSGVNNEGRPVFSESEVKKGEGQIFGREMEYIPTVDFTLDGVDYKKGIPISQEVYSDILNSPNGALLTTQIEAVGGKYFSIIAPIKFIETFEYPQTWLDPRAKKVLRFASLVGITSISAVTINPKFFLGNLPKDWLNALMHSEAYRGGFLPVKALKLGKDILSVSKDAATKGKLYRELMTYGGGFNTLSQEESPFETDFLNENKGLIKGAQKIYDGLSYLGSTSEIMTRLAIYARTEKNLINKFIKENGGRQPNELQRVEFKRMAADASRSIMDYSKKGNVSDIAGTLFPFFNAGIRAVAGAKKSWVDDPVGTATTYGWIALGAAGLLLYNLRPENEDDYEKIDEKIKLNNFIIILPYSKTIDGKKERAYIKIPKSQSAQLLSNATEQSIRSQMGKKFNQEILFEAARNTFAIPEISPYSIPTVAAYGSLIHGYDHYHKRNVWNDRTPRSEGLKYVPTGRNKTPKSIVDLGEKIDVAPVNIELALKQIAMSKDNIYFRAIDGGYRQIVADMTPEEKLIYDENVLEGIGNSFLSKFLDYAYDKPADKKEIDKAVRLENDVKVRLENRLKIATQLITDGEKTPAESEMAVRNIIDSAPNNLKYSIYKKYTDYLKNKKYIVTAEVKLEGLTYKKGALINEATYRKILESPKGKSLVNQIEINDDASFLEGLKYIDAPNVKAVQFLNEYQNKETDEEKNNFIRTAIEMKILPKEGLGFKIEGKVIDTGKGQVIPKYSSSQFELELSRLLREEKEKENQLNKQ